MLRKNIFKSILLAGSLLLVGSCQDFIEEPQPSANVAATDVFTTEAGVRAYFTGIYRNLRTQWSNGQAGGSTDSWGIVSLNIARSMKGDDILNPQGWYQWDYRHENREPTYRRVNFVWDFLYETVNQANVMLQGLETSSFSEATRQAFQAEARAIRAWAYFELVREFQHTLAANPGAPAVPVYLEPATAASQGNTRATVQEVYEQITSDLEFAVQHAPPDRLVKSHFNINVVQGLAARVYLEMQEWEKARDAAIAAREGFPLSPEAYDNGFNDLSNPEWIWAFPQTADQTVYYGTPASFWDHFVLGYNNFYINENLVNQFSDTDVRNLFYQMGEEGFSKYVTTKFTQREDFADDFVMMRSAEMYLIEAEARAELGNEATAAEVLLQLQQNRDPNAEASGNTGDDLIDEILMERRKELYGEFGVHFLDIKRRQLPLERTGNHPPNFTFSFPANSERFILKIPQRELDANININDADQNN